MKSPSSSPRWPALLIFLAGLALYWVTQTAGLIPGESARTLAQYGGLDAFPPLRRPLFYALCRGWTAWLPFRLTVAFSLLNALLAAVNLALTYTLVRRRPTTADEDPGGHTPQRIYGPMGAVVVVLTLALSFPFWSAATRAATAQFDIFWLLLLAHGYFAYARGGRRAQLCRLGFILGVGAGETPAVLLAAPVIGLFALSDMLRHGEFRRLVGRNRGAGVWRDFLPPAGLAGAGLLGLALSWGTYARWYARQPVFGWREMTSVWSVVRQLLRLHYLDLTGGGTPQVGRLLIFFVAVLPALYLAALPRRVTDNPRARGNVVINTVFLLFVAVFLLLPRLAPGLAYALEPSLAVPALLVALWSGYLAEFWWNWLRHASAFDAAWKIALKRAVRRVYPVFWLALLGAAGGYAGREALGARRHLAGTFAADVVATLDTRPWLLANGALDDLFKAALWDAGRTETVVVNARLGASRPYLRYLADRFADPRERGLALLGLGPLLTDWVTRDPAGAAQRLAVFANADLWLAGGLALRPDGLLYSAAPAGPDPRRAERFAGQRARWARYEAAAAQRAGWPAPVRQWNELLLRHVSKTANDTGYYLEEQGQPDEAWEAYQAARRIEPNNLSALLNLITLAAARQRPEEAALRGELQRLTERSRERFNLWALAYHYGYVRRAEAFAGRGMAWAMSGKPNLAVAEIQRAMGLGLRGEKIQLALADAYLQQDKVTEGEAELRRVLADNPKQPEAISALLQLALRRRDFDAARAWLARYREAGGDAQEASFREAIIELQIGNRETARDLLDRLLRRRADYAEALTLRLLLAHEDQDAARFDALAEPLLKKSAALSSAVQRTLARLFLFRREPARARELLNLALRRQPADLQALDLMLRLCILEAKRDEAEDVVQRILTIAPRHAFANMALGSIQLSREMYELAEASYRASLQTERDPLTLNELAYTLHLRGKNEEALPLIREALEKNDRNGAAWDTLGAILLRLNRLEEAEPALQKALALLPEAPDIIFHMALLYEARGLRRESRDLAEKLMERPNTLRPAAFDELRALLARLRGDAPPRP